MYVCVCGLSSSQQSSIQSKQPSLTVVAVLARPAWQAFAEVSTNQVAADPGVDAGTVGALVGI